MLKLKIVFVETPKDICLTKFYLHTHFSMTPLRHNQHASHIFSTLWFLTTHQFLPFSQVWWKIANYIGLSTRINTGDQIEKAAVVNFDAGAISSLQLWRLPSRTHTLQKLQVVFKRFSFLVCIFRSRLQVDTWPHRLQLLRLSPHRPPASTPMQVGIKCLHFMNDFIFIFSLSLLYLYLHHNATWLQIFSFHEHLYKLNTIVTHLHLNTSWLYMFTFHEHL